MVEAVSPEGNSQVPVCTMYWAVLCSLRNCGPAGWCIVRTIAYLSARCASRGRYSQTQKPGTALEIAPYSARTPTGASGLGSQVSCCDGPPDWKMKTTDLAGTGDSLPAAAWASSR